MARTRALTAVTTAAALAAQALVIRHATAQQAPEATLRPSVAATAIIAAHPLGLASVGLEGDAGLYARLGLAAGVGVSAGGGGRTVGEVAATGRFLLDPLRQSSRGVYATGGLALRLQHAARPRTFVLAGLGVEGRPLGRFMPAIEAGIGGGTRVSVVLRPLRSGRR